MAEQVHKGPPRHKLIQNPSATVKAIQSYVQAKFDADEAISLAGCARALKVHKARLTDWSQKYSNDRYASDPARPVADALKSLVDASEEQLVNKCYKSNSSMALALLKCCHRYVEEEKAMKVEHSGSINIVVDTGVCGPLSVAAVAPGS